MEHDTFDNESDNDDMDEEEVPRTPRAPKPAKNGAPGAAGASAQEGLRQQGERAQEARAHHDGEGQGLFDLRRGQRAHAGEHRVVRPDGRLAVGVLGRRDRDRRLVVEGQGRQGRGRRGRERRGRRRGSRRGRQEGRGRGRGGRRRLLEDQRPGAHVPAQDGLGRRCSPARARSRSPSGSRTASGACCRSCSTRSVAIEEILELGDKLRKQKIRVKEVVKDIDEEDAEFDEQWHIERVCKVIDKVRRLWKEQEKVAEKLDAKAVSEPTQEEVQGSRSPISSRRSSTRFRRCASTRSRSTRSC